MGVVTFTVLGWALPAPTIIGAEVVAAKLVPTVPLLRMIVTVLLLVPDPTVALKAGIPPGEVYDVPIAVVMVGGVVPGFAMVTKNCV